MRKEARRWLAQSELDLQSAEANVATGIYYVGSLFAQQAVEKALKGLYIEQRLALPPRTHNLSELGAAVGAPRELEEALQVLTPLYFSTRYPDAEAGTLPSERFSLALSQTHVAMARDVVAWVTRQLNDGS